MGGSAGPCANGVVYCGNDNSVCGAAELCVTGCCVRYIE
jgi:hypothetical protein